ncbi:Tetratricopeptide repeat protein 28 [Stylophora pistillata]|uniref:Tetratricopeptide repeat protein 28 n=1 Tax=Stylophora pistillata TaxID=50429 RepID=A0A2B4R6S5_STYPI|nr:Tetratricopeptide repeat protein 28 [Stylophora pistillata]
MFRFSAHTALWERESSQSEVSRADILSEATSSYKGVDLKASSSVADSEKTQVLPASGKLAMEDFEIGSSTDALKGKDSANQGKVDLDDELSSGQIGLKESDDDDCKSTGTKKSEAASVEKKPNMKDAPLAEPDKTQIFSTPGKIEDLEIGTSTDTLAGKDSANQEKVDLDDEISSGQFEFKESDDGDAKSTVSHQASPAAGEGSLAFSENSSADKSEVTSVEKKLNMKDAPLEGTLQDKVTAIQEKLDLDDGPSSDYSTSKKESYDDGSKPKDKVHLFIEISGTAKSEGTVSDKGVDFTASSSVTESEKTQVSSASGKKEDLEIGSPTDTLKGKDSVNQEKVDLNEELLSGQFGFKKESDVDDDKSTDYSTFKKESFDDGSKPKDKGHLFVDISNAGVEFTASSSVAEWEKNQVSSATGKIEDLEIGSSTDAVFLAITGPYIVSWVIRNGKVVGWRMKHVNNFVYQDELEFYITALNKATRSQVNARAADEWEISLPEVGRDGKGANDDSLRNSMTNALRKLHDIIVTPIADFVEGDEIVFVPEGPLCLVPYAALVDSNSRYLCESFRIRVLPSLSFLKLITDCPKEFHVKTGALLVGDPCYKQVIHQEKLLSQLPGARKEVKMIGEIIGIAPLIGEEATKYEEGDCSCQNGLSCVLTKNVIEHGIENPVKQCMPGDMDIKVETIDLDNQAADAPMRVRRWLYFNCPPLAYS